jgi:hypothetical protein
VTDNLYEIWSFSPSGLELVLETLTE